jgi:hypothetical protein
MRIRVTVTGTGEEGKRDLNKFETEVMAFSKETGSGARIEARNPQ